MSNKIFLSCYDKTIAKILILSRWNFW